MLKVKIDHSDDDNDTKKFEHYFTERANAMFSGPKDFIIMDSGENKSEPIKDVVKFQVIKGNKDSTPQAYENGKDNSRLKADIKMIDSHGNEVGWISHKAAPTQSSINFNQYARVSSRVLKYSPDVVREIEKFKRDIVRHAPPSKIWPKKKTMWAPIILSQTKNEGIFGMNYGNQLGRDNVTVFGQGHPIMNEKDDIIYLTFSNFSALNGHQELFMGVYEPVLYVRSDSSARSFVDNSRYDSLAFFIQPKKAVSRQSVLVSNAQIQSSNTSPSLIMTPSLKPQILSSHSSATMSQKSSPWWKRLLCC